MLSRIFIKVVLNHLKYLSVITTGPKLLNKNLKVEYLSIIRNGFLQKNVKTATVVEAWIFF